MTLKPCPFCANDAISYNLDAYIFDMYQATCHKCGLSGPRHKLQTKAISLWNQMQVKQYEEKPCCCDDCIRELEGKEEEI